MDIENNSYQKVCDQLEKVYNRININKTSSFQKSELFINYLVKKLQPYHKDIFGTIEPFCDSRKQGLMLALNNQLTNEPLYIWACEDEVDNDLMIITSKNKNKQNLYMTEDIGNAQFFSNNNLEDGVIYITSQIEKFLFNEFTPKI